MSFLKNGLFPFAAMNKSYGDNQKKQKIEELEKKLIEKQNRLELIEKHLPLLIKNDKENSDLNLTNNTRIQQGKKEKQTLEIEIDEIQNTLASIRGKSNNQANSGGKSRRKKKRTKKSKKSKRKRSRKTRK
jgi:hypothetical protein